MQQKIVIVLYLKCSYFTQYSTVIQWFPSSTGSTRSDKMINGAGKEEKLNLLLQALHLLVVPVVCIL